MQTVCGKYTVPRAKNVQGDCVWITRDVAFSTGWQHARQVQLWFLVLTILVVCVALPNRRPCQLQYVRSLWVSTLLVCTRGSEFLAHAPRCQAGVHAEWKSWASPRRGQQWCQLGFWFVQLSFYLVFGFWFVMWPHSYQLNYLRDAYKLCAVIG